MNKTPQSLDKFPESIRTFFSDHLESKNSPHLVKQEYLKRYSAKDEKNRSFAWIQGKSGLPWLQLDLPFPAEEILKEARKVRGMFVSHRSGGTQNYVDGNKGWSALTLHGLDPDKTGDSKLYGYPDEKEAPYRWTEIADLCPITTSFFKDVFPADRYDRVRFSNMEPGGYIFPHTDRANSYLGEVNFALNHPQNCYLKIEGKGYVPFAPGRAFVLDVSGPHAVVNLSNEERYHMIIHSHSLRNERWQELIGRSYRKFLNSKLR